MLYVLVLILLFALRYLSPSAPAARLPIYYFTLWALFLFSAFRFQVGCDWDGYYYQYQAAASLNWLLLIIRPEPIWWAILGGIADLGFPYPAANFVSSAIFFIGIHILARRQPDPLSFLVLLFPILIINMPMSGIRQGAAIGIMCVAYTAFVDRRPIRFAFWVFVAAGFHQSAIVFLLLLPLTVGRYSRKRLLVAALLSIPGVTLLASGEGAGVAASRYIGTNQEAFGAVFRVGLLALSASYFFLFFRKKWLRTFPVDFSLASAGAIGMVLVSLLVPVSTVIGDRFGYYLVPIQAMIFARFPYLPLRSARSLHVAIPYLILFLVFGVWSQMSWMFQVCYIPYNSWILGLPSESIFR